MPSNSPTPPDRTIPRLLLFGHPGSGKSSLLGALVRAAETQGEVLGAEVVDTTHQLTPIRDHLYAGTAFKTTRTELVCDPIGLCPLRTNPNPDTVPSAVELIDCDGIAATSLLRNPDSLAGAGDRSALASAVVQADLLVLVVNAGASDSELRAAFEDFLAFLERLQGGKEFRREVGGFPVFVVLSQCDRLALKGDTRSQWEGRVRGNLRRVTNRFNEFLEEHSAALDEDTPYLPFGSVNLQEYAVAVRRPACYGDSGVTNEPYGVAELFRDAFAAAKSHRDRARASDRRLLATVWALIAAVGVLISGVMAMAVFQPPPADPGLADRVRVYEIQEAPAAVRLAEKTITRNKRTLTRFRDDPGFFSLPEDLRTFVEGRLREINDYQSYSIRLAAVAAPAESRSLDDLDRIQTVLTTEAALPPEYTWADTEAAQLRDKWLADVPLIRQAEGRWQEWYLGLVNQATGLTLTRSFEGNWRGRVEAMDAVSSRLPWNPADPIPGSATVPQSRGEPVPLRVPYEFDRVYQARRDWEFQRSRLFHLRDLAGTLGLTAEGSRILVVPPPGPGVDSRSLPADRLADLRRQFPRPSELYPRLEGEKAGPDLGAVGPIAFPEWTLTNFPEPGRTILTSRAREEFANATLYTRSLILTRLGVVPEIADTTDGWSRVADALDRPPLSDWGRLLHVFARLENPRAPDPGAELATFLRAKEFDIDLTGLELAIPLTLRIPRVVPTGPVTITITPRRGGSPQKRTYKLSGEGMQQGLAMLYRFGSDAGFIYRPGDGLRAEVPVRSGDQVFTLVWEEGLTRTYQVDRLGREPRLVRDGDQSEPATGVILAPALGSTMPRVPVLLPDVRR